MPYICKINQKNIADCKKNDKRKAGDVVGVYNELPNNLSDREKKYFDFIEITKVEFEQYQEIRSRVKLYHKSSTTEWTSTPPEMKEGWEDEKGNVYELTERPWRIVSHTEAGFKLNVDEAKNKNTVLVATKEGKR